MGGSGENHSDPPMTQSVIELKFVNRDSFSIFNLISNSRFKSSKQSTNQSTTVNDGHLGSRIEEERSEMR